MNKHNLAQTFDLKKLLRFVMPTIIMMIFMSLYTSVDGAFVSRLISEDALAAVNVVYPVLSLVLALGLMFATGANAIISRKLGEGKPEEARRFFTAIYITGFGCGVLISVIGFLFQPQILALLGATDNLREYVQDYYQTLMPFAALSFWQMFAQNFFVTEGKPHIGLIVSILGGVSNIVLDYIFIAWFHMGIAGAALATGIGYSIPGIFGALYFTFHRSGILFFTKPSCSGRSMLHTITNGSSELVNNLSVAITTLLFNLTMLKYAGESGVSAITVILYVQFIQAAIYFGYAQGISPVISYKYGESNHQQLRYLIRTSIQLLVGCSIVVVILSFLFANPAIGLFISPDSPTFAMTKRGFLIFSSAYLFMGINVFLSALFTAFGNGKVSALLSFLRTLVFIVGTLLLLPLFLGIDGVWVAVPISEFLSVIIGFVFYLKYRSVYHYG
ncbi:MAG: MATE family efflux transporter [Massiliimalia sp.]|jgi:putative MATE family efflux protein